MTARISSTGIAVPAHAVRQQDLRDFFCAQPDTDRLTRRRIAAVFDAAGIEKRHTVLSGFTNAPDGQFIADDRSLLAPTTSIRNELYRQEAPLLAAQAARNALADGQTRAEQVTDVITVSCTGFFAPGIDYRLVQDLGLSPKVQRSHLGFIGCAAALPALRLASQITQARPEAVVLVVCVELCSLHIRHSAQSDQIVSSSIFADGAAAALVTGGDGPGPAGGILLDRFATALTSQGESDMFWTIGDHGFEMTLSAEVPRIIGREIREAVEHFLGADPPPDTWAVHPGGRSVLDRVEAGLDISPAELAASRAVLRDYGNISSATIVFVLHQLLHDPDIHGPIAALAFGPGLTVESALLHKIG